MKTTAARLANRLYHHAPGLYRSLYGVYKQWSDREERRLLASIVRPGMTVLDVGANIGIYTRFLAGLVGPAGRVLAFEPEPRNYERLAAAVATLPQVTAVHAAVAERSGTLSLHVADDLNVDHHSYDDGEGRPRIDVPAVALDDRVAPGAPVDVIKMDIQGAELGALAGARRILAENRQVQLVLEYWPFGLMRAGAQPRDLIDFLESHGLRWHVLGPTPVEALGSGPNDYVNLHAWRE